MGEFASWHLIEHGLDGSSRLPVAPEPVRLGREQCSPYRVLLGISPRLRNHPVDISGLTGPDRIRLGTLRVLALVDRDEARHERDDEGETDAGEEATEAAVLSIRANLNARSERADESRATELRDTVQTLDRWLAAVRVTRWPLPKPETKDLLDRMLSREGDINLMALIMGRVALGPDGSPMKVGPRHDDERAQDEVMAEVSRVSPTFIILSSLMFEFVMLALAAWIFCRRDF